MCCDFMAVKSRNLRSERLSKRFLCRRRVCCLPYVRLRSVRPETRPLDRLSKNGAVPCALVNLAPDLVNDLCAETLPTSQRCIRIVKSELVRER